MTGGPPETMLACARAQREADPLSLPAATNLIRSLHEAGRDEEALTEYQRSRDLDGDGVFTQLFALFLAWELDDAELAETILRRMADAMHPRPPWFVEFLEAPDDHAALDVILAAANAPSLPAFMQMTLAAWLARYGDADAAADALSRAVSARPSAAPRGMWSRDLAEVRRLPAFKDIVRELGLVDYWRTSGTWPIHCRPLGEDDFECS